MKMLKVMWPNKDSIGHHLDGFHLYTVECIFKPACIYFCDIRSDLVKKINEWKNNKDYDILPKDSNERGNGDV